MYPKTVHYAPLKKSSIDDDEAQSTATSTVQPLRPYLPVTVVLYRLYLLLLHAFAVFLGVLLLINRRKQPLLTLHLLPSEPSFVKDAIRYEDVTFDPSGFWENKSQATPYEGPPTPEVDERWSNLVRVGMYSITRDEYAQLGLETSHSPANEDEFLITLEVFHQLHCLNYIRKVSYDVQPYDPADPEMKVHLAHCVDSLRQTLMCHSDLTPITLTYDKDIDRLDPNFRIKHTCRDFQHIWNFAEKRNSSGWSIEGKQ